MGEEANTAMPPDAPGPVSADQEALNKALLGFLDKSVPLKEYADDIRLMLEHCRNRGIGVSKPMQEFLPLLPGVIHIGFLSSKKIPSPDRKSSRL